MIHSNWKAEVMRMTSEEKKCAQGEADRDLPETEEDLKPEQECEEAE